MWSAMANFRPNNIHFLDKNALRDALLLWTVPMVITSFFTAYQGTRSFAAGLSISLISAAPFLLIIPFRKVWFSSPLSLRAVLAFGLGALRAWVVNLLSQDAQISVQGFFVAGLFALFWWLAVENTLDAQGQLARRYQALTSASRQELAGRLQHELMARDGGELAKIQDRMEYLASRDSSPQGYDVLALAALENEISATTRQMGFFQSGVAEGLPKLRFLVGLSHVVRNPTFDVKFAGLAYGAMSVVGSVSAFSLQRTSLSVPLSVLIFVGFLWISNRTRTPSSQGFFSGLFLLLGITMPILIPDVLLVAMGFQSGLDDWRVSIGTPLTLFAIAIGSAVIGHLHAAQGALLQHLAVRLSDHEVLAIYLHNSVKSELLALAKRMESCRDPKIRDQTWGELKKMLSQDIVREAKASQTEPKQRFHRVLESWKPILEVDATGFLKSDASSSPLACRFVEEAIANAYRHALATNVEVLVEKKPKKWIITVQSNGCAETTKRDFGFGLSALEQVAEAWTLTSGASGSVLKIHLPKH